MSKPSKKQKVAEQVEAAYEKARDVHEEKHKDHSPGVYASRASALKFAEKKFVELCGSHWHDGEEEEEDDDDDEGKIPMDNPSLFKSGDGFSWNGEWIEQECAHQMRGEISVRLKPMKLLA
ncbi:hypothetical protein TrVE_jg9993 [Triparma verrucosa]|uniref:Uncharacterized protein n=1 Tax=Triparma verrucosa TaxID=1606542 RepID=A0A9W7C2H7_9STRA|nr:hypothetical protein TrVE_jg9993 [Triparma verrucosa]